MKENLPPSLHFNLCTLIALLLLSLCSPRATAVPAELLFEDHFTQGIPGWTSVQPSGATVWVGAPLWQYDIETKFIWENSNVYTDDRTYSSTRRAAMLINDTVAPANFTFTVRMRASDNDACGLIWGYLDEGTFYRVVFANEAGRVGWPFTGWNVDRMVNGEFTDLFGRGNTNVPYTDFTYTANRMFDVVIGMTNGLLSVTVVDDSTNAPVVIPPRGKPTSAGGSGGQSWRVCVGPAGDGHTDGLPNVGVRFHSVALEPTPLAGGGNPLAPTWSTLITPRGDGTADVGASPPIWCLMLDANGTTSRLREASGRFQNADNDADSSTNFCAATVVAGDALNWSNYVFSARCIPSDDDAWGLMVRYQNPTNWYRIGFRRQNAPGTGGGPILTGCKGGLSIQKCVNGVFIKSCADGIAFPRRTFGTANYAADVYVAAIGDQLQVLVVANPTAASPTFYSYGPFADTSLTKGMIGLFSWAQQSIDYDFARVQKVSGQGCRSVRPLAVPIRRWDSMILPRARGHGLGRHPGVRGAGRAPGSDGLARWRLGSRQWHHEHRHFCAEHSLAD